MTEPTAAGILSLWERVAAEPPGRRAALLAAWAAPGADPADLSAGQENETLLHLYQQAFGPTFAGVVNCPACDEPLDVGIAVVDLVRGIAAGSLGDGGALHDSVIGGYAVQFRVPSARDLAEPPTSGAGLLAACLAGAVRPDGSPLPVADLPPDVVAGVEEAMAEIDPGAELSLSLSCPACGLEWPEYLDPVEFLSVEVEARAREAIGAVHILAAAYGWSESEILGLSPWRMRLYLDTASR